MSEPDFNLLVALDALLAEGSVTGAARRLALSGSAMSRTLNRLRQTTGDPLLVRAGRRMVLTPYAREIREATTNAVLEARALLRPSRAPLTLSTLNRTFTLRCNEGFVEAFGARLIAAVEAAAPLVRLCFVPKPEKNVQHLREGRVDLEIGVLGEMGPEIRTQALFRDRFVGVVRKGHALERLREITASDYAACGHIVASRRGQVVGPVDSGLTELGLVRRVVAVVPSFACATAVARASDLVALVPASFLGEAAGRQEQLFSFALPIKTAEIVVSLMWHPSNQADPAHRWLRQLLLDVCGGDK